MRKINILLLSIITLGLFASCSDDFIDLESSKAQTPSSIKTVADAQVTLNGAYDYMQDDEYYGSDFITLPDVLGEDCRATTTGRLDTEYHYGFYTEASQTGLWIFPYRVLKQVNNILAIVDGLDAETDKLIAERNDLKGQALALRALAHFDLVRLYGKAYSHDNGASLGVPIVTEPLKFDAKPKRNTVAEVYTQVIKDFTDAIALLSDKANNGKINKWAAKALLSRVYLYHGDDKLAFDMAVDVITNSGAKLVPNAEYVNSWVDGFNTESLFEIANSDEDNAGLEAVSYLWDKKGYGQIVATDSYIAKLAADPDDVRNQMLWEDKSSTDDSPRYGRVLKYPGKANTLDLIKTGGDAKSYNANVIVIRLSEVYLIAAEAGLKAGEAKAIDYLNAIVSRANPANEVAAANFNIDRILEERSLELIGEGHRLFDLVRNKKDVVRTGKDHWGNLPKDDEIKGKTIPYNYYKMIQPIPRVELDVNELTQNPKYES
ncbi:MAG: RagB/SusD family nutrient uptake outer membrane protein [Marinifilaceae bacterium]|jgi:hypothetical protein|nr:RagB/SusD family nutrient uptake outer membrane protein [Marinifilaceae bacterium]